MLHEQNKDSHHGQCQQADQDAVIGHDDDEVPVQDTIDNFGQTTLLFAKDQQNDRVQKKRNAISLELWRELDQALIAANKASGIRSLILRGEG